MKIKKHKIIPSGYVVLKRKRVLMNGEKIENGEDFVEEVLLSRRYGTGFMDGMYGLPAGHGEEFESLIGCAIREAKEEIGVNLRECDLELGHIMNRFSGKYSKDCRIDGFFVLENYETVRSCKGDENIHGKIKNMEPNKCDDLSWFPINLENGKLLRLPQNTIPYIKLALENIQKNIIFSEV